jgi:hypothetical protein
MSPGLNIQLFKIIAYCVIAILQISS